MSFVQGPTSHLFAPKSLVSARKSIAPTGPVASAPLSRRASVLRAKSKETPDVSKKDVVAEDSAASETRAKGFGAAKKVSASKPPKKEVSEPTVVVLADDSDDELAPEVVDDKKTSTVEVPAADEPKEKSPTEPADVVAEETSPGIEETSTSEKDPENGTEKPSEGADEDEDEASPAPAAAAVVAEEPKAATEEKEDEVSTADAAADAEEVVKDEPSASASGDASDAAEDPEVTEEAPPKVVAEEASPVEEIPEVVEEGVAKEDKVEDEQSGISSAASVADESVAEVVAKKNAISEDDGKEDDEKEEEEEVAAPVEEPIPAAAPAGEVAYAYTGPEPKKFAIAEGQTGQILGASLAGVVRLFSGGLAKGHSVSLGQIEEGTYTFVKAAGRQVNEASLIPTFRRPSQPLEIYEFEGCPFCKKVREAVSILALDVIFYPCPRDGPTWRVEVGLKGGKKMFPYMVDPGAGVTMYESDDIIRYLFTEYGDGEVPFGLKLGVLTAISCSVSLIGRIGKGSVYRKSKLPEKPIVYWGYEGSPFCKVVKETLCELELPHLMKHVPRGSEGRQELFEIAGTFQVPYIQDPNTGVALFESSAIIEYLNETYAV